jgi:hypothetical protein
MAVAVGMAASWAASGMVVGAIGGAATLGTLFVSSAVGAAKGPVAQNLPISAFAGTCSSQKDDCM